MNTIIPIPWTDPADAFGHWADQPWAMLLDSSAVDGTRGRYSYIAVRPRRTILAVNGRVTVNGRPAANGDPFSVLQKQLGPPHPRVESCPLPFQGGAVGLWCYELGRHLERAPARHPLPPDYPEMAVGLYDVVAGFDMRERRAWVVAVNEEALPAARAMAARLALRPPAHPRPAPPPPVVWQADMTPDVYRRQVSRVIDYIRAGDVFQVNLTQRFVAPRPRGLRGYDIYRRLRQDSPAPFAAFLRCGEALTVASASPERFLSLSAEGLVESRPIKGTRPRGASPAEDLAARRELALSEKDRAENLMIADLLRNDIGRVAEIGSVRVPVLAGLECYRHVHHLVSVVTGHLRAGRGPVDLLRATFPGGSITGAPKVRALEIIDELEPSPRGAYCGAIGWIGYDGAMDSSIVIRALALTANEVIAQAGGGIVADSDPEAEYAEMMCKVAPALAALSEQSFDEGMVERHVGRF